MRYFSRFYYTLIEIYEQRVVVLVHEIVSRLRIPITPPSQPINSIRLIERMASLSQSVFGWVDDHEKKSNSATRKPVDWPSIQQSEDKDASRSEASHFRPVDLIPAQLSRSNDWYRAYGWRGS